MYEEHSAGLLSSFPFGLVIYDGFDFSIVRGADSDGGPLRLVSIGIILIFMIRLEHACMKDRVDL